MSLYREGVWYSVWCVYGGVSCWRLHGVDLSAFFVQSWKGVLKYFAGFDWGCLFLRDVRWCFSCWLCVRVCAWGVAFGGCFIGGLRGVDFMAR